MSVSISAAPKQGKRAQQKQFDDGRRRAENQASKIWANQIAPRKQRFPSGVRHLFSSGKGGVAAPGGSMPVMGPGPVCGS